MGLRDNKHKNLVEIKAHSCYNLYISAYLPYILERLVGKIGVYIITRSSNGRTAGFGPVNRGSSPCRVAMKNKKLFWGGTFFGVLLLGVVTNAIWELLKPVGMYFFKFLLNLSFLGKEKFKNGIYEEVAKGFHEGPSFEVFQLVNFIFLGFIFFIILITFVLRSKVLSEENNIDTSSVLIKINNFHGKVMKKTLYAWFLFIYFLFSGTVVTLGLVREKYINNSITHFHQLITIIEPYVDQEKILLYKSRFAQIKNKNDYVEIIINLENISKQNNQNVPKFNFVF